MTLDGGAHAIIQSIDVFFGNVHISSIDEYAALFAITQDFTTDLARFAAPGRFADSIKLERAMMDSLGGIVHCPTLDYQHFRSTTRGLEITALGG
ncbi:hypothetical protein T492DRAFT_856031 [Pavlovales sp. CCMP2436]|nr:hypothetical protein T492DRAFT_856031 [Pavlovales sp. CCMP2436]